MRWRADIGSRVERLLSPASLRADALAGLLGAVLALPQGIAFATLAGLPPEFGIYTAIVPCIVAAVFGSSRHVVSGPTNANSLALFAALSPLAIPASPDYIALALAVTGMVGVMQLALGASRLGWITDFIAPAVLIGFMSGAAILIGLYAVPDALGIELGQRHGVLGTLAGLAHHVGDTDLGALSVAACTLLTTVVCARISPRLPFMLIGVVAGYALSELIALDPGWSTIRRIGAIPSVLPPLSLPFVPLSRLPDLISIAGALSIVALGQSVSIAKAMARRSGQHLDIDREFIGQGLSNVAGSFFSSYVSCGSLNRSLPNQLAGARTPLAAVLSAGFLVVLALATRPLLERLPMPAIAALLIYVAYGLIDARGFARLARVSRADLAVATVTLGGMLLLPFQHAILIGSALSLLVYLNRTAHPAIRTLVPDRSTASRTFTPVEELDDPGPECPQIKLIRIEGSVYFGAAGYVTRRLHALRSHAGQNHLLVMAKSMNFIDLAGVEVWEHELAARRAAGGDLYFHRPRTAVTELWSRTGFDSRLGPDHVFGSKARAVAHIYERLDHSVCATCPARIFKECQSFAEAEPPSAATEEAAHPPGAVPHS